jgi:3-hydroxy acid dehydrogenase / malonic semialdehyde reductase
MEKIAMITGATSGIGEASALTLARLGYHLVLTGRRTERLMALCTKLNGDFGVSTFPLAFDIQKNDQTLAAWESLPAQWKRIDLLLNNAGLAAGFAPIDKGNWDHWEQMIDTNVKGLLFLSRLVIPQMVERQYGQVVNLSSIAGKETYENGNVYCATKHAVEAITKAMRIDLLKHGIKVSSISPGAVETEFSIVRFDGDADKAKKVYDGLVPLSAQDVADTLEFIVTRPAHVNINDVLIMPTQQASSAYVHRK